MAILLTCFLETWLLGTCDNSHTLFPGRGTSCGIAERTKLVLATDTTIAELVGLC
ncbi:hypothetical protein PF010_g32673 [Phytophthora fragariae]|uniref:Uncharacterized protein n=1 Tax=Phytophthora fragariae TaxID=53985 RepID=A0A6G0JEH6_9STRA|nr:hypothetical protein PF003_g37013 [Phytophthora fragariae]KAE9054109.1 hypothetical protein PF010_g32673 [Phytophthora fragariae]